MSNDELVIRSEQHEDAKGPHFLASVFIQGTTQWTLQGDDKGVPGITFYGDDSPYLALHFADFVQLERLVQDLTSFLRSQPPRVEVAALTDEQMEAAKAARRNLPPPPAFGKYGEAVTLPGGFASVTLGPEDSEERKLAGEEARRVDAASERLENITDAADGVVDGEIPA